jgi:signal transduction histidine kinase
VLWASGFSLLPALIWGLGNLLRLSFVTQLHFSIFFASLLIFFPVLAYAILRHRLGDTDLYLSRAMTYAVLAIIAGAGYALVVSGVSLLLNTMIAFDSPFLIGLLVFGLALAFDPMRQRALRTINTVFFRGTAASQEQTREFTNQLSQAVELDDINRLLRDFVERDLFPLRVHIYVYNQLTDLYEAAPGETTHPTTDIRFARGSGLVSLLSDPQTPSLYIGDADLFPEQLESERTRLQLLGAQLFIALPGQQRLAGWVALGPRRSGANYSSDDLNYLNALCEQAALAIERTQVMADKDRRVLEMNVLTRVAQGVNVTLDFDDILELIFAQTSQVMPTDDFAITLYYQETESWRHVFYVENDERLETQEEQLIPPGQGLERVVLQSRRFIMTDDYDRECRNARVLPAKQGIYAWMGVPLNAGAETIGVVSAASRDPVVLYTEEQRDILQAIADQAAGAIVKARLLEESERRARQLATLNEVAQGLSSTLDIDPLLKQILDSAVELLNCETGSLLTIDDETQEAVFAVVNGPVADKLLGTRLPLSEGLVGKAINERLPVVVNNVGRSDEWSESTDKKSGFETRGLLVVPMMVQDRVTGVIETLNKRDGQPFNQNDVELLMAFTAQAAVALENARLYTMTDQALTERVEELSVMGRIDRELNASLDVERAMRITLQWALRQSDSSAGLIGFVGEEGVRVIASERYHGELRAFGEDEIMLPRSLPIIEDVLNSGRYSAQPGASLRAGARSQIALPIRREEDIIGLLLLESNEVNPYTDDVISFLSRLSDHAAIAINNAQLYAEVQRANIAKSDFVSLVSHELKTPMTSIKGYADLLLAGAVGEVSEGQQNFLGTIRTNIDRMATLVSDLADVSRIEAGRLKIEFAPVELQSVIDEVLRSTHAQFEEKNQKLVLDIPPDLPAAWGDRNRIVQVLTNLVSNAHKYTNEGGSVTVRAAQSENLWDPQGASQVIRIAVEDTGIGIKEEDQKKIFTQYFRTQEGRDNAPGTGLGLNISRNLVEMQGGKIWFESVYGKGTTFLFTLPVADLTMVTPNEPA